MSDYKAEFVEFAIASQVQCFGEFKTKAGRMSPYFFNAGLFNDGDKLKRLGEFYAKAIVDSGIAFDVLFGPAYKGIPLAASIAIALAGMGKNVPFAYNRKEAKDHGEGGTVVGAELRGRVLIVDDVISAGTSVRESVDLIRSQSLFRAVAAKRPGPGLIHHSDRGSQYCAHEYRRLMDQVKMKASMSRRGDCYDNAPMESFWGTLKNELVHHSRYKTREQAIREITEYIDVFYNRQRRQARLSYLSPAVYERQFYANQVAA